MGWVEGEKLFLALPEKIMEDTKPLIIPDTLRS